MKWIKIKNKKGTADKKPSSSVGAARKTDQVYQYTGYSRLEEA